MKEGETLWTREQLTLAINLYTKLTFGEMHARNPKIIAMAPIIGRSANAVAMKLVNFASLDSRLKQKGMSKVSNLDREVWVDYSKNWDELFIQGEQMLAKKEHTTIEKLYNIDLDNYEQKDGREVIREVKVRLDQTIFRSAVFTNFDNRCCVTGIGVTGLIVASHIVPWSEDSKNRLNPQNGLTFNALLDKAFDTHLITVTEDLKIKVSSKLYQHKENDTIRENFINYDGKEITLPKKFYPGAEFLKRHNEKFVD